MKKVFVVSIIAGCLGLLAFVAAMAVLDDKRGDNLVYGDYSFIERDPNGTRQAAITFWDDQTWTYYSGEGYERQSQGTWRRQSSRVNMVSPDGMTEIAVAVVSENGLRLDVASQELFQGEYRRRE